LALRIVLSHYGEKQFQTLLPILKDYRIIKKLSAITYDNTTTNDTLCRIISTYLKEKEGIT